MKNNKVILALISVVSLALIIALIIGAGFIFKSSGRKEMDNFLYRAENSMADGFYLNAIEDIKGALALASSETDFLKVLKRSYTLAEKLQDYTFFITVSKKALENHPTKHKIMIIAGYGAMKAQDLPYLNRIAKEGIGRSSLAPILLGASILADKKEYRLGIKKNDIWGPLGALIDQPTAPLYLEASTKWSEKRFLANGALFSMKEGKLDYTYNIFRENLNEPLFDRAAALVAYDKGELDFALYRMKSVVASEPYKWSYKVMLGDFFLLKGQNEFARSYYLKSLADNPTGSPVAYLNLSNIYRNNDELQSSLIILEEGLNRFPDNHNLALEKSKLLRTLGKTDQAEIFSSNFLQAKGFSPQLELLNLVLRKEKLNPWIFIQSMWQVFHKDGDNPLLGRVLTNELLRAGDVTEAEKALNLFVARAGVEHYSWYYHYRGVIQGSLGNYEEALAFLEKSLSLEDNLFVRLNQGIILLKIKKWARALEEFRKITLENPLFFNEHHELYSNCVMNMGKAYMNMDEISRAKVQFEKALRLNPDNYTALLLLKRLQD